MNYPIVTIFNNKIEFWKDVSIAKNSIQSLLQQNLYQAYILSEEEEQNILELLNDIDSGKVVCTDKKYDLPVLMKANAALVLGRVL